MLFFSPESFSSYRTYSYRSVQTIFSALKIKPCKIYRVRRWPHLFDNLISFSEHISLRVSRALTRDRGRNSGLLSQWGLSSLDRPTRSPMQLTSSEMAILHDPRYVICFDFFGETMVFALSKPPAPLILHISVRFDSVSWGLGSYLSNLSTQLQASDNRCYLGSTASRCCRPWMS